MQLRAIALRVGSALLLAACGGGSSGGGRSTPEVVITTDDADLVAAEVMTGLVVSTTFANTSTGPGDTGAAAAVASESRVQVEGGGVSAAVVVPPTTFDCADGGTVTIAGDVAVPGTLSSQDQLETDFDMCRQVSGGPLLTGMFDFTVIDFQGDLDEAFLLALDARFGNFRRTEDGVETSADGTAQVLQDTRAPLIRRVQMTTGPITFAEPGRSLTLTLFNNALDEKTEAPFDYVITGSGTLISSVLGGARVDYGITDPLEGTIEFQPTEGELLIQGADAATILLVAEGTDVTLSVDIDADDSTPRECCTIDWSQLYAQPPVACVPAVPPGPATCPSP